MIREFDQMIAKTPSLFLKLRRAELLSRDDLHGIPQRGVYVLYIDSPVMQTLFEVYAALALKTPYNDFDTY